MRRLAMCIVFFCAGCGAGAGVTEGPVVMSAGDVFDLPRPAPDRLVPYGADPLQFGELRLPKGPGPHPVAVVVHGGCWLAEFDLAYMSGLAKALADTGIATWSVEYRRVGDDGGGWPGTFLDVAAAADHLRSMEGEFNLDLDRVVAVGHSAGGHLALWLAARTQLATDNPLRGETPLSLQGVVALAGIPDLAGYASPTGCGSAVEGLLGGPPSDVPERVRQGSPIEMVPFGVPQILITGEYDHIVPREQADAFTAAARLAGDEVQILEIEDAGHFELVDPAHTAFESVRNAVLGLLA